jgi:hypothetical protein
MKMTSQADNLGVTLPAAGSAVDAASLVTEYLTAFYTGDFDRAGATVAPDFSFQGPFLEVQGRDKFFAGAQGLQPIVRGHRLLRQWIDGTEVCSIYDVTLETPKGTGSVPMSEWHTVRAGQLAAARVLFDAAAFRALLPQP